MGSNFQKCTCLETDAGGTWCLGEGILLKDEAYWRVETEREYCWGVVVEHMLHDADAVVHCDIMNLLRAKCGYSGRLVSRM